jgi:hypothetical protein
MLQFNTLCVILPTILRFKFSTFIKSNITGSNDESEVYQELLALLKISQNLGTLHHKLVGLENGVVEKFEQSSTQEIPWRSSTVCTNMLA